MAADRSIVARLRAEASQFISTMDKARKATKAVGEGAEQASKQADSAFSRMARSVQKNSQHIDRLGNTALIAGGAITAGLGFGVKAFADFDAAMSSVNAALPEAGANLERLRQAAIDLGKDTQFSATEAAQGITELGKAGVSAEDILGGGLKGALDLAASGQLGVAEASEIAATAMVQFKRDGQDVPHIADLLAAGAGKAQGSVHDLGMALNQAGLVASATGASLEETTGTLAAFASAGLVGSDAGTSLKTMLQRLTPQSDEAAAQFEALGISAYDAQGNFVGLSQFAGILQNAMKDLTPEARNAALSVMFGADAVRGANVLYEQGARGIAKWTGAVNDAGFAAEQARKLTDNLKGDVERLGGALDAVFVQNGEGVNGALRQIVQSTEGMVEAFGSLPSPVQQGALAIAGITGVSLLAVGAFAKAATTGADLVESMETLRVKAPKAAKGLDLASKAARTAGVAFAALTAASVILGDDEGLPLQQTTRDLLANADAVDVLNKAIADLDLGDSSNSLEDTLRVAFDPSFLEQTEGRVNGFLRGISGGLIDLGNPADFAAERLDDLDQVLASLVASGNGAEADRILRSIASARPGLAVEDLTSKLPGYRESLAGVDNQQKLVDSSADGMAGKLGGVEKAAADAQDEVSALADEIRGFGKTALDADDAESKFRDAVEETRKTVEANAEAVKNGEKTKSEARRENRDALRDQARAALENSAATLEATGSAEQAAAKLKTGREEFIKSAGQMGINADEAEKLADKYGLIPQEVKTTVKQSGAEAARTQVQNLIDTIARLNDKTVKIRYVVSGRLPNGGRSTAGGNVADADGGMHLQTSAGLVKAFADGGTIGSAQPQIRAAGGAGILWAETGAGPWEAFISGHPNKRARSRMIAQDTVERLGGRIEWARPFANGGFLGEGFGPESHDNRVVVEGDVILPSANLRQVRNDVRDRPYRAKARPR